MMQTETEGEEEAILESFCSSLGDLTVNSKPLINILTKVASKNVCYANAIVKAVGSQLEKAPTVVLLPLLYLIDSILKNVGGEYISLFSSTLKNCFAKIFAKVDRATRQSMCNLRQTWSEILSSQELSVIDGEVQSLDPSWPSTNSSLNTLQNPFLKILVNPSFLPAPPANKITLEDEEEENLRELLIQQMLKRKLEKEQNFQEPRDDTDKTTCEKDTSNSSLHVDSNQSQADSTTAEKLITTPIKENQNSVAVPVHTDNKAFTKQANGELLQFLTNLISQGNKRLGSKQEDREPSHRYSRKREEHRQDYKDYRKRQKFSKCHGNRVHYGSWKQDVECEYSSWREDKIQKLSGRYQKNLNSPSDLSQEESGLSLAAKNVDNSSASRINKESLQTLQANSCGSSKPSEALHCPLNDAKPDLLHLASPHDQSRSNAVDYWRVTRTRMLDSSQSFENQAASPLLKEKSICSSSDSKSSRLSNSVIEPSDKISFHRKCPLPFPRNTERQGNIVEIRPVREIDYKHGYGAPEKRLCGGLSDDSDGKCMTEIHHFAPQHSVPLPLTVPSQCNDWQVSELVSKPQLMFNNDEKFMKKIAKESWGSKIVTHVECNMMNLPPVNKFPGDQTVEQSINSVSVDSVTRQVHVYTEKTQYSGNLIKGPWFHTGNTSLLHAAKPKRGFAHKGKKKRARTTERLQRQAAKSAKLSNAQFQLNSTGNLSSDSTGPALYSGELADCGIITKQTSSVIQSAKTSCVESVLQPCVNVHALFQSLCDVGLLTRQTLHNNNAESSASSKSYEVDFSDPFSLKRKQPGIVELLYNGLQCCSCGERFAGDRTAEYRGHLDWHFIQNHKVKDSKTSLNRNWFGSRKCWTQTEQFPGCRDTVTSEEPDRRESSVPSHDYPRAVVCGVCRERFDEFFNEDQDEWHLKDCLSCKGVPYHPFCFKDCDTSRSAEQLNISKPDDGRNGGCLKARADKDLESNVFSVIAPLNNEHHSQIIELHGNNSPPEQTLAEQPATPKILPSESLLIYHEDVQSTVEEHDTNDMPSDREQVQAISAVQSLHETSLCEQNEIVRNFEQEDHCSSPNLTCDKIKQLMPNELSTTEVEIIQVTDHSSEDNIADDLLLSSLDINGPESDVSILKPKLVGRRLTILPVVLKGTETSNLCCLS